uniref:Uncharacterized protein n=1 Tax=Trieres chinensis TaxID=1514140 RepID=A0A7S1ZD44_TRICV|mmetsp:Transcript_22695/g.46002  ORF Transcript_22695/g.46002 Transcript_22695/m.46002 type:complete len:145 (+) Transcript_22695:906-1340(+)
MNELDYEAGDWAAVYVKGSSNLWESKNLVQHVERGVRDGIPRGTKLFIVTDNFVFKSTYYKGSSTSPELHEVTVRLHLAEMRGELIVHLIHCTGMQMKEMGMDGLLQGDMLQGMMAGIDPLSFLPLGKGTIERSSGAVEAWVQS